MAPIEERLEEAIRVYGDFMEDDAPSEDEFDDAYEFDVALTDWDQNFRVFTEILEETLEEARATNPPDGSDLAYLIARAEVLLSDDELPEQHAGRTRRRKTKKTKGKSKKRKSKSKKSKARKTRRRRLL